MSRAAAPALLSLLAASCGTTGAPPSELDPARPDVLLVTVDTLRADHVGAYGHDRATTPVLDSLAAGGALFETAYAPTGATTPSHASLFTGRHPLAHGVTANGMVLPEEAFTLAEALAARGWRTAAFVSSAMASSRWGLTQGFAHVDERLDLASGEDDPPVGRSPSDVVDACAAWLREQPEGGPPLFVWLHLFDPHSPWEPPEAHAALFPPRGTGPRGKSRAAYEAELHYSDAELGRLLPVLEERPGEPLVIATSDHGEGLWDHGWPFHSRTTFEEELRVPWIVRWPGRIPAGLRLGAPPAALRDLPATLAGLLGIDGSPWAEGQDQSARLLGRSTEPESRDLLFLRPLPPAGREPADWKGPGLGLLRDGWKVYWAPLEDRLSLFRLPEDPHERRDLAASRAGEASALAHAALAAAETESRRAAPTDAPPLSAEDLERLRALGYLH